MGGTAELKKVISLGVFVFFMPLSILKILALGITCDNHPFHILVSLHKKALKVTIPRLQQRN